VKLLTWKRWILRGYSSAGQFKVGYVEYELYIRDLSDRICECLTEVKYQN